MPTVSASLALFGWIAVAPRADAGLTGTTRDAAIKQIKALDEAARFEEKRAKDRCPGPPQGDPDAAASAERAAHIHRTRLYLARDELSVPPRDLVALALQVARNLQIAYACDPAAPRYLEESRQVLEELRTRLPEDDTKNRETLQRELVVIAGALEQHKAQKLEPIPAPATPPTNPTMTSKPKPPDAAPSGAPRRGDKPMSRLALRFEAGYGLANLDDLPSHRTREQRGGYFRLQVLARFNVSERRRVLLLFGPYYSIVNAIGKGHYVGDAIMQDAGAHLELQWTPLSWLDPWLSLNPFLNFGIGHNRIRGADAISGVQAGGGIQVCVWHSAICPGVRLMTVPSLAEKNRPTVQVGLALDLMALIRFSRADSGTKAAERQSAGRAGRIGSR